MNIDAWALQSLCAALLAGNLFFVKRLIDKIERAHEASKAASAAVGAVANQLREIKTDIKDLRRIEIEVAVMRGQMSRPRRGKAKGDDDHQADAPENGEA